MQDQMITSPIGSPVLEWDDYLWDRLLESISRRQVIPILGPALSTVEHEGREVSLNRFIAVQLAMQFDLSVTDEFGLGDIIAFYVHQHRSMADLYSRIYGILKKAAIGPSRALSQIATITHFNLFVTTSFDLLLEEALNCARFRGEPRTKSLGFVPKSVNDKVGSDITTKRHQLSEPTVYHLFGKVSLLREYVVTDEDLLDYIEALFAGRKPKNLFDALGQSDLLLLGANFSDWLVRLFLRLVKTKTQLGFRHRAALEILADEGARGDRALVTFLSNFSLSTRVFQGSAPEFIGELTTRWSERFGGSGQRSSRTVFISYAREDAAAARALSTELGKRGVDVWFDDDRMKGRGGTAYDDLIRRTIKDCGLFLPLLSKTGDRDTRDAYFRREWHFAEDRDTRNAPNIPFILPIVVDDSSRSDFKNVPERFLKKHILRAPGGRVTDEIEATVKAALGMG
jgi:hypothetical protein